MSDLIRKRFTRRTSMLTLAGATAAVLAACGERAPGSVSEPAAAKPAEPAAPKAMGKAPANIERWVTGQLETGRQAKAAQVITDQAEAYMEANPNTVVDFVYGKHGHPPNLIPVYAAGAAPNLVQNSGPQVWVYAGNTVMLPLNDYMKRDKVTQDAQSDFYPTVTPAFTWRGKLLFFCTDVSMEIWMCNMDFWNRAGLDLPQPGWTWDDAIPIAEKLKDVVPAAGEPDYGVPFMVELPTLWRTLHWVHQNGSDLINKEATEITIDDAAWIETHEHLRDMWQRGLYGRSKVLRGERLGDSKLPDGKHAAELEGMTRIPQYRPDMAAPGQIGYAPSQTKKVRSAVFDSWCEGVVNTGTDSQKEAAYGLAAWGIRPEHLAARLEASGNLPPRRAVSNEPVFQRAMANEPLQAQASAELEFARTFPMSPVTLDIRIRVQKATQEIVMDGKPAPESLTAAKDELQFLWEKEVLVKS